jgi:uncharacterized protein (TIGR02145 family)
VLYGGVNAQVGIGTTLPSNDLDVEGSGAAATAIDINNKSTGDPKINFQLNDVSKFSIGVDNSDAAKFKIGTTALETGTAITIDASQNVGVGTASPASTLDIQGSLGYKVTPITAATTLNQTHNVVLCNTGPYTVTLPAAASNTGKVYYIKNIDAEGDDITLDGNASETIDGDLTFKLDPYKHAIRIVSDGTNWHILEESSNNIQNTQNSFNVINCNGSIFSWSNVTNAITGKVWMDRNLGATQVATSSTDANSYGDLYQWGRLKDGHQCRTSSTTSTASKDNTPMHGDFITSSGDWRSVQNDNLWQGVSGVNNPCPSGYRLPTETELTAERDSWTGGFNAAGAFATVLKLPMSGERLASSGSLSQVGTVGSYWSSTVNGTSSRGRWFLGGFEGLFTEVRAFGSAVRCIKN